jgi:uncharacterized protein YjbI with pentapeptide repeats
MAVTKRTSGRKRSTTLQAPRLGTVDPQDARPGDAGRLTDRESHDAESFEGLDLTDRDLEGSSFTECVLRGLQLGGTRLRGSRFIDTVVLDSFAPALAAPRTTWRDVRIERPRWGSAELFDAELEQVLISGGKIDYLNLRESQLTDVVIDGCSIGELDLGGVRADRVALRDCRIGTLDVTRADLVDVDLRSSSFDAVTGLEGLRGVVVDDGQLALLAPLLAAQLGIVVA